MIKLVKLFLKNQRKLMCNARNSHSSDIVNCYVNAVMSPTTPGEQFFFLFTIQFTMVSTYIIIKGPITT